MSSQADYVLNSLFWSLAGGIAGYALCAARKAATEIHEIKETVVSEKKSADVDILPHLSRSKSDKLVAVILILLAASSLIYSGIAVNRESDKASNAVATANKASAQADCQTKYNLAFSDALNARTQAANLDRAANTNFYKGILDLISHPSADPAVGQKKLKQLLDDSVKALAEANAVRAANPLPTSPKEVCGDS